MNQLKGKKRQPISVAQQVLDMKMTGVGGQVLRIHPYLNYVFQVRPTEISRPYTVRLLYKIGKSPEIYVIDPDLHIYSGDRKIPHLYDQKKARLCLYQPKYNEWNKYMFFTHTIIPWVSLWLFYFEEWVYSNDWKGGGEHPE